MQKNTFLSIFILCLFIISACSNNNETRTITVTGSAKMDVEPDEIVLVIGVREYWEEEFENKNHTQYKTKIHIDKIEDSLSNKLNRLGINQENITISRIGNRWQYYYSKEILIQKQFTVSVKDLELIDKIISEINFKGVEYIQIQEYKNSNITEHRKKVKIDALNAGKEKAKYLLEAYNQTIDKVVKIVEINNDRYNPYGSYYYYYNTLENRSNYNSNSTEYNANQNSGYKKINLRYEMEVTFKIK